MCIRDSPYRSLHTAPASNTKVSERKHHRNNLTTTNNNTKSQGYKGINYHKNYPNKKTYYNHNSKQVKRFRPNNEQTRCTKLFFRGRQTESGREIQTPCLIRDSKIAQTITKPSSTNTITDPKVFNLSSRNLTACEIQLLSKGLKYTPTPQRNHHELKTYIKSYTRRLRRKEFFYKDECEEE